MEVRITRTAQGNLNLIHELSLLLLDICTIKKRIKSHTLFCCTSDWYRKYREVAKV